MKRRLISSAIIAVLGSGFWGLAPSEAQAVGYPMADVQSNVYARIGPSTGYSSHGVVLRDTNGAATQRSAVHCYADGGWATGNYTTNRWFRVYVYDSAHGYGAPHWLYVHASYVYNQPAVGRC